MELLALPSGAEVVVVAHTLNAALCANIEAGKGSELTLAALSDDGVHAVNQVFVVANVRDGRFTLAPRSLPTLKVDCTIADSAPILWDADDAAPIPTQQFQASKVDGEWCLLESCGNEGFVLAAEALGPVSLAPRSTTETKVKFRVVIQPATSETLAAPPAASPKAQPSPQSEETANKVAPNGMSREEFLRSVGLTTDDVVDPAVPRGVLPRKYNPDDDGLTEDFIKHADLSDPSLFSQPVATNAYLAHEIEKYRVTASGNSPSATSTKTLQRSETESVHDTKAAAEYKSKLLDQFRSRKTSGMAKTLPE